MTEYHFRAAIIRSIMKKKKDAFSASVIRKIKKNIHVFLTLLQKVDLIPDAARLGVWKL